MRTRFGPRQLCTWEQNQVSFDLLHLMLFLLIPIFFSIAIIELKSCIQKADWLDSVGLFACRANGFFSTLPQFLNFAQWRYTNQWSFREVVLLLVENWIPIPRLERVKYRSSCQFLMVSLKPVIALIVSHPSCVGRRFDYLKLRG